MFLNAVAEVFPGPGDTPLSWLDALQALERHAGRRPKTVLNEARPLDLDLVAWGGRIVADEPRLVLPHPRARDRRFVLAPLAELAPAWEWPGAGGTVQDWLNRVADDPAFRRAPGI